MDNFEYLQKISQSNRPTKKTRSLPNLNFGLILKVLLGGIIVLAISIGISIVINAAPKRTISVAQQLYLRMNNVNELISTYNKSLKSSQLRSINLSLSGTLSGTMPQLASYIRSINPKSDSNPNPLTAPADVRSSEKKLNASVTSKLANAKLNGTLDRIYVAQIHMQVSLLMSLTSELLERDSSTALNNVLGPFFNNLAVIEDTLNNYAPTGRY